MVLFIVVLKLALNESGRIWTLGTGHSHAAYLFSWFLYSLKFEMNEKLHIETGF
jgi:hypothetical protein